MSKDPDYIYSIQTYRRQGAIKASRDIHRKAIKNGEADVDAIISDARKIAAFVLDLPKAELHLIGDKKEEK